MNIWVIKYQVSSDPPTDSLYGSRHLAEQMSTNQTIGEIKQFILLDLIGGKNMKIRNQCRVLGSNPNCMQSFDTLSQIQNLCYSPNYVSDDIFTIPDCRI